MRTNSDKRQIEYVQVSTLTPYARNSRTHTPQQVKQIAASIREFGFTNPVLIDEANGIIAGHGRVMAAEHLQLDVVPCIRLDYLTEAQKRAYVIADNKLALNAGWDDELLKVELDDLQSRDYDLSLLGFDEQELQSIMDGANGQDNEYTRKIESPIYTPKGEQPSANELYDDSKTLILIDEIKKANLPSEVETMLTHAAHRHTVFHFGKAAEYYSHADAITQDMMERSAMVIVDYGKAIEQGFVRLTEKFADLYNEEWGEQDAK